MLYLHYYKYFLHVKECICLLIGIIPIKGILKEKKIKKTNKRDTYLLCAKVLHRAVPILFF